MGSECILLSGEQPLQLKERARHSDTSACTSAFPKGVLRPLPPQPQHHHGALALQQGAGLAWRQVVVSANTGCSGFSRLCPGPALLLDKRNSVVQWSRWSLGKSWGL